MSPPAAVFNAFALALLFGLVHCSSAREEPAPQTEAGPAVRSDLGGTTWRLVKFEGGDETTLTPDDPARYTIAFQADGRLNARIDCNRGMGTWKSSGPPELEFGPLALTRVRCPPGSLHDQIVRQWPYVRSYVVRDGHLFMSLMADGGIYEFEPVGSRGETTVPLENTYWKLTHLDGGPITEDFQAKEPHLILDSGTRRAGGSGGCNGFSGNYEVSGDRLELDRMASTMMACLEGMETERAFLNALGQVSGWRLTGTQLELTDAGGKVLARFEGRHMK
jgi:heat shock protein HslJ